MVCSHHDQRPADPALERGEHRVTVRQRLAGTLGFVLDQPQQIEAALFEIGHGRTFGKREPFQPETGAFKGHGTAIERRQIDLAQLDIVYWG